MLSKFGTKLGPNVVQNSGQPKSTAIELGAKWDQNSAKFNKTKVREMVAKEGRALIQRDLVSDLSCS